MKRVSILLLLLLTALFVAGCGAEEPSVLPEPAVIAASSEEQPVEYGASLDEWDEAVSGDAVAAYPAATLTPLPPPVVATFTPAPVVADSAQMSVDPALQEAAYTEILWDALVPADFSAEAIMEKYAEEIASIQHGSGGGQEIYAKMQEEFNNAPVNEELNGERVKLPGFIAPLEYEGELITKFLLVPYFGACIHTPPPPVNQTVLVDAAEGEGISPLNSYAPVWITGVMTTERLSTELAESGYYVQDALIEPYK